MEKVDIESLKQEASRYVLPQKLLNELINNLEKELIKNKQSIIDANREDVKVNKKQIKIQKLVEIIDSYKNVECLLADDERKIVVYKGDPYLTLHLCMQALVRRNKILLVHDQFMIGVNKVLFEIIQITFQKYNITNLIQEVSDLYKSKDIQDLANLFDKVIVIGDSTMYQLLELGEKSKFFTYNNIVVYCDSRELDKLQEAIYLYAIENCFEVEIIYEENIGAAIEEINNDEFKNIAILFTKSIENEKKFKNKIKGKTIYINENPFKNEVGNIGNYFE